MAHPPAGWHPDPLTRHAQRYWDGNQWTEHVADQSGNMSTDPLDGGQSAQQTQQDTTWGQSDQGAQSGEATDQTSWGQDTSSGSDSSAWGSGSDSDTSWGDASGDDTATSGDDDLPTWQSSQTEAEPEPDATDEPAWGTGAGAAGAAAAAGSVADDDRRSAPVDGEPGDGDAIDHVSGTQDLGASNADVSHPTIAAITVGMGVVVRHGHIVAASPGLSMHDSEHPGATSVSGAGIVHVGANGRQITVLDVPASGLTIANDALVAHSTGLDRAAAANGIVGHDATAVTGGGWVAVAAEGGALEVSPVGGVDVTTSALVAWSSDLDVAHADTVTLTGRGTVLVSSVTA